MISTSQLISQGSRTPICSLNNSSCHGARTEDCHMSYGYMVMGTRALPFGTCKKTMHPNCAQQGYQQYGVVGIHHVALCSGFSGVPCSADLSMVLIYLPSLMCSVVILWHEIWDWCCGGM